MLFYFIIILVTSDKMSNIYNFKMTFLVSNTYHLSTFNIYAKLEKIPQTQIFVLIIKKVFKNKNIEERNRFLTT